MRRRLRDDGRRFARGALREKTMLARELRARSTEAEAIVWQALRGKKLGVRFRRQHVVAGFIVDFYCAVHRLAIELDGDVHASKRESDAARTRALEAIGVTVLRFPNEDVVSDVASVIAQLRATIARMPSRVLTSKAS